jgi:hypothetical protein
MIVKIYIKRGKNKKSRGRATTSNSNIEKKELHQRNYMPLIVKIYIEMGKNKKSSGRGGDD